MNIDKYKQVAFLNSTKNTDTALVFASYQPNKVSSDLLRIALKSLENINLDNISVWIIDVGSPKAHYLVSSDEFKKFNFIYVDYTPRSWEQTPLVVKILKSIFLNKAPRAGSNANAWSLEFAISYFNKINYKPKFFMTLQTDVIFTKFSSIMDLREEMLNDKKIIAGGFREQLNLGKKFKIIHSLGCMWNLDLFKKLKLNLYPDLPNYDVAEKAIALSTNHGYKILSYLNLRTDKHLNHKIKDKKYLTLGNGVDIFVNKKFEVVFLHLGRGIEKSKNLNLVSKKFSALDWINWYETNFKDENFSFSKKI